MEEQKIIININEEDGIGMSLQNVTKIEAIAILEYAKYMILNETPQEEITEEESE